MNLEIQPYLTFDGNCEEAFNFYKPVFGNEFVYVGRFNEMPPQEGMPPMSVEFGKKIMHIALPIHEQFMLFGSDNGGDWAPKLVVGNNITLSIKANTKQEADQLFKALSQKGTIGMPMSEAFWGSYFGTLTDQFGINWMIAVEPDTKK